MPGSGAQGQPLLDGGGLDARVAQGLGDVLQQSLGRLEDVGVDLVRVVVAHLDGAPGEAVVELAEEDTLPHVVDLLLGIAVGIVLEGGNGCEPLDLAQQVLRDTVVQLVVRLGSVGTSVQLEIQLTVPGDESVSLGLDAVEEVVDGRAHVDARKLADGVADATQAAELLEVLPGGAAAAVALAEDEERGVVLVHGLVPLDASLDVAEFGTGRVGLGGRHVAHNLRAIQGDPVEGGVGEVVDVVPAQLLGQEAVHASEAAELRDLGRVSERVRQPEGLGAGAKVALEEALAVEELADEGLAAGHVGVVLDPAASDGVEAALGHLHLDAVPDGGVELLQPFVLLGLGAGKVELGVALHQVALVRPRAGDLALGLVPGPEPAAVDVAVPDAVDEGLALGSVDLLRVDQGAHVLLGYPAALLEGVLVSQLEGVDDVVGNLEGLVLLPGILGELEGGVTDHPDVDAQLAGVQVDGNDLGTGELEVLVRLGRLDGIAAGGVAEHAVAGHLDVEGVLLAVAEGIGKYPLDALAIAGETLQGMAFLGPHHGLVVSIPMELEMLLVAKLLGDRHDHLEPVRGPGGTKKLAHERLPKLMGGGLLEGRPILAGSVPDGELDVRLARGHTLVHHGEEPLVLVLSGGIELLDAVLVELVDALADRGSGLPRIGDRMARVLGRLATHDDARNGRATYSDAWFGAKVKTRTREGAKSTVW